MKKYFMFLAIGIIVAAFIGLTFATHRIPAPILSGVIIYYCLGYFLYNKIKENIFINSVLLFSFVMGLFSYLFIIEPLGRKYYISMGILYIITYIVGIFIKKRELENLPIIKNKFLRAYFILLKIGFIAAAITDVTFATARIPIPIITGAVVYFCIGYFLYAKIKDRIFVNSVMIFLFITALLVFGFKVNPLMRMYDVIMFAGFIITYSAGIVIKKLQLKNI